VSPEGEKALREAVRKRFGAELAEQPFAALVNISLPAESRILLAPVSEKAGGWGQIAQGAWQSQNDPAYQEMFKLVEGSIVPRQFTDVAGTCGRDKGCRCGGCFVRLDFESREKRAREFRRLMDEAKQQRADADAVVAPPEEPAPIPYQNYKLIWVDSEETEAEKGQAVNAFDGNPATFWHTEYRNRTASHPHELILDLGAVHRVVGFVYVPRGGNGDIRDYELCVARAVADLEKPAHRGRFEKTAAKQEQRVLLEKPVEGRYVRLRALTEAGSAPYTTVAEFTVLHGK
jgi:hypothetical protein